LLRENPARVSRKNVAEKVCVSVSARFCEPGVLAGAVVGQRARPKRGSPEPDVASRQPILVADVVVDTGEMGVVVGGLCQIADEVERAAARQPDWSG